MIGLVLSTLLYSMPVATSAPLAVASPEIVADKRDHDAFCSGVWAIFGAVQPDASAVIWFPTPAAGRDPPTDTMIVCDKPVAWTAKRSVGIVPGEADGK